MPRKASGSVVEPKDGRGWAIRFRAYGKRRYVALGSAAEGWTKEKADKKLGHVLADVERDIWKPEAPPPDQGPTTEPTFHEFASEWFEGIAPELASGPESITSGGFPITAAVLRQASAVGDHG